MLVSRRLLEPPTRSRRFGKSGRAFPEVFVDSGSSRMRRACGNIGIPGLSRIPWITSRIRATQKAARGIPMTGTRVPRASTDCVPCPTQIKRAFPGGSCPPLSKRGSTHKERCWVTPQGPLRGDKNGQKISRARFKYLWRANSLNKKHDRWTEPFRSNWESPLIKIQRASSFAIGSRGVNLIAIRQQCTRCLSD